MKIHVFALIFIAFSVPIVAKDRCIDSDSAHTDIYQDSFVSERYVNSMLPGALIGGGTGLLCAFLDYRFPDFWPLTWLILGIEREALVHALSADMHYGHVGHKKQLMESSSWLAAWVCYLLAYDHFKHEHRY